MKFTGRPQKLPRLTALNDLPYREKSPKLSIGPEKYETTRAVAAHIVVMTADPESCSVDRLRLTFQFALDSR